MATTIEIEPLSSVVGAEVRGIDLKQPIDDAAAEILRDAFARYSILCVPGQKLSATAHARFASVFGPPDTAYRVQSGYGGAAVKARGVMLVSNIRKDGVPIGSLPDGEMHFHSDGAHRASPYRATTLYSLELPSRGGETKFADLRAAYDALSDDMKQRLEIPSRGGDTLFANLAAAYDALDEDMKARLHGLQVRNLYGYDDTFREETTDENAPNSSSATHELVRLHPVTGRRSLYLSRLMTRYVIGMDRDKSDALLHTLFDHAEKPEFVYAHKWAVNDLVIWDNCSLNHARTDFPAEERRLLRRYTITEYR